MAFRYMALYASKGLLKGAPRSRGTTPTNTHDGRLQGCLQRAQCGLIAEYAQDDLAVLYVAVYIRALILGSSHIGCFHELEALFVGVLLLKSPTI